MVSRTLLAILLFLTACPFGWGDESDWLSGTRQLTFEGRRAGEGYFSPDGSLLVFQSERDEANPFFQIFLMDWATGDITRVSPGQGKTTCAWVHPNNNLVLFASTHQDPKSVETQKAELELRASGKERRYAWDYDPQFELFAYNRATKNYKQLTQSLGYDAEGSYSPNGKLIAFASNRRAFRGDMSPSEKVAFDIDPAVMNDIYLMNADGSNVRRITETLGYDGGPFFSPDGERICWRRFAENGATAEIMTMNIDGTDKRQLTKLDSMSWAPFYHPSGEYLIFTTNIHGFSNFELYIVDTEGGHAPVRVTTTEGFDGLPAFTPDGIQLAWTSNRTTSKQSQIFMADWNHEAALRALGKTSGERAADPKVDPVAAAASATRSSEVAFKAPDMMRHVDYLCRPELAGRLTGSEGELLATSYVAAVLDQFGIEPVIGEDQWFQDFEFTAGVDLGANNRLERVDSKQAYRVGTDWQPLAFSNTGNVAAADVVFAGYGIVAPKDGEFDEYDSYVHLDVQGKWACVLRYMPEDISAEQRQHLSGHSSLRYKAMVARDRGAHGLIVVSGPRSKVKNQLVKLQFDGSMGGTSIPVISVRDEVVGAWLSENGKQLIDLQAALDTGEPAMGFMIDGVSLAADISIQKVKSRGRNVLGRLKAKNNPKSEAIIVGAHIDHLGAGGSSSSLARDDEAEKIHFGADDNASGIAAMLEIAEFLSNELRQGRLELKRDVIFAAWSGEELGLIGSSEFATEYINQLATTSVPGHATTPETHSPNHGTSGHGDQADVSRAHQHGHQALYPSISACLNMDMVGRFEKRLVLQGVGSSSIWKGEIERRNAPIGLPITLQDDSYLPTDASTFYMRGVPILSAFTGSHSDYHTPRDTPDKLNYVAAAKIARLMGSIARSLVLRDDAPDYQEQVAPGKGQRRARLRAHLGTIPDYTDTDVKGVRLSGVGKNGPAAKAGLRSGDLIVKLAGRQIENIYDYTYAIEALKIGQEVECVVQRGGKEVVLKITPGSRE